MEEASSSDVSETVNGDVNVNENRLDGAKRLKTDVEGCENGLREENGLTRDSELDTGSTSNSSNNTRLNQNSDDSNDVTRSNEEFLNGDSDSSAISTSNVER